MGGSVAPLEKILVEGALIRCTLMQWRIDVTKEGDGRGCCVVHIGGKHFFISSKNTSVSFCGDQEELRKSKRKRRICTKKKKREFYFLY